MRCELEVCDPASVNNTYYYDVGGQWVGPTQTRFLAMAEEYGVKKYEATQCESGGAARWQRVAGAPPGAQHPWLRTQHLSCPATPGEGRVASARHVHHAGHVHRLCRHGPPRPACRAGPDPPVRQRHPHHRLLRGAHGPAGAGG